jgi:hypothetical protein
MHDKYTQAALKIIKEQELLIGPLAFDLARRSSSISFNTNEGLTILGDPKAALESLVTQFNLLFGRTSVEVSKQALKHSGESFLPEELPEILK